MKAAVLALVLLSVAPAAAQTFAPSAGAQTQPAPAWDQQHKEAQSIAQNIITGRGYSCIKVIDIFPKTDSSGVIVHCNSGRDYLYDLEEYGGRNFIVTPIAHLQHKEAQSIAQAIITRRGYSCIKVIDIFPKTVSSGVIVHCDSGRDYLYDLEEYGGNFIVTPIAH